MNLQFYPPSQVNTPVRAGRSSKLEVQLEIGPFPFGSKQTSVSRRHDRIIRYEPILYPGMQWLSFDTLPTCQVLTIKEGFPSRVVRVLRADQQTDENAADQKDCGKC